MNKLELQSILMDYFKSNDLFGKDKNFLVNKASMQLGIKKDEINKVVAFLIEERVLATKNGSLVLGDNTDQHLVGRDVEPEDIKDTIVAVIKQNQHGKFVAYPIDGSRPCDIQQDKFATKYQNQLCMLAVTSNGKKKFAVIKKVIGNENDFEAQVLAHLVDAHVRLGFDESAKKQAEEIQKMDISEEIAKRSDWRYLPLIAVDPKGCKDRDDAFALQKTKDGYRLFVAITDITFYVPQNSPLAEEAYIRSTSHYNPIFSVPMFPHNVTNSIFSLDEGQDRLVLGCVIDFDKNGNRIGYHFERAVARIHHAMSYEDFEQIHNGNLSLTKFEGEKQLVDNCYELAQILNKKLNLNGKINADTDEPNFVLSKDGKDIVDVTNDDKSFSHKVVETFMIEANRAAGQFFVDNNIDGIYRIHQKIDNQKFNELCQILQKYGIDYKLENNSKSISGLVDYIKTLPFSEFVQRQVLSKLFMAQYSPQTDIHFGLGFSQKEPYTHFTSPARRYADNIVHKIITDKLEKREAFFNLCNLESACMHINNQTAKADKLERRINGFAYCYLANKKIGKTVDAIICQFDKNGVVVKDKNSPMTFVIDYQDLTSESGKKFSASESELFITNGQEQLFLGDEIKCQISSVDFEQKKIYATSKPAMLHGNLL